MITLEPPRGVPEGAEGWRVLGISRGGLTRFAARARELVGVRGGVDVLLTTDTVLRRLNREYRGKDKATDVLSFPAAVEVAAEHAGDLAVSLETAARQAKEHGYALGDEVRVLLLHGLLHLSGMDHEADRGEMAAREAELRLRLRLPVGLIGRAQEAGSRKKEAGVKTPRAVSVMQSTPSRSRKLVAQ